MYDFSKSLKHFLLLMILILGAILISNRGAVAQEASMPRGHSTFSGFYLGAHPGFQNLFGGSFIKGQDVLAQEWRFVLDFSGGYRHAFFDDRLIAGLELRYGFTDGDLVHKDHAQELSISYKNSSQRSVGGNIGVVMNKGRNLLAFVYINETKRNFDVDIIEGRFRYAQSDRQGMLKYGIGIEQKVGSYFSLQATLGKLRVDFGDLETNIDVEDKMDVTIGGIWIF